MIALRLSVPVACWRKGHARELLETEPVPPPATCYGALLSLVGETDRERHRGCRVSAGLLNRPARSTVVRSLWRIKSHDSGPGNGDNVKPDLQQLVVGAELVIWCDSADEDDPPSGLEPRVLRAFREPERVDRFGGWSLGESTHLVNDAWLCPEAAPPSPCKTFVLDGDANVTLPVWVDHVGSAGTIYAVGAFETLNGAPERERLPAVPKPATTPAPPKRGAKRAPV